MKVFVSLAGCALLCGCASALTPSGFIRNSQELRAMEGIPFDLAWIAQGFSLADYSSLAIAPVSLRHLKSGSALNEEERAEVMELARFAEECLLENLANHYETSSDANSGATLVIQTALTEIDPSTPLIEAAGMFFWGAKFMNGIGASWEVRLVDAHSGKVVAQFADRESPPLPMLGDIGKFSRYRPLERIIERWTVQLAQVIAGLRGADVDTAPPLTIANW